jgi:serine protease
MTERPEERDNDQRSLRERFRPRAVFKLHDWVEVPYEDGVQRTLAEKYGPGPLEELIDVLHFERLHTGVTPDELNRLVELARERDPAYGGHRFDRWYSVDAPPRISSEELVKRLLGWEIVETARPDAPAIDPVVSPADDPRSPNQGYLDPAPNGIDAEFAWTVAGGAGAGQRFVDLEQGWTLDHEDLDAHGATLLFGTLQNGSRSHGTSVLGEVCAVDNTLGCVGITPEIASVDVTSHSGSLANVAGAITAALPTLGPGNVLLLEVQTVTPAAPVFGAPIELLDDAFEAIRLATALGVSVVEAGGNGSNDLDAVTNFAGNQVLNPASVDFRDSGAIVVGAASSTVPHTRMGFSSFGPRIDCYAWGENVNTCDSNSAGAVNLYKTTFSGTSSASPIITGAALAVQGVVTAAGAGPLSPGQLRSVLSDAATGTASSNPAADEIGVMPDLRAIIEDRLDMGVADVYLRDNVADTGMPHNGAISTSPDVILRPAPVPNPQLAYGEGSGTEGSMTLGYEAVAGQDNYIYTRVRNRGASIAGPTTIDVYWSEVAMLITPDMWNFVGTATLPAVFSGDILMVADEIVWAQSEVPAAGHYCFVAIASTATDPAPPLGNLTDFDNFMAFIRNNNNATWRNFNVVPSTGPSADPIIMPFLAVGALDRGLRMGLEVIARLPEGARLVLEAPDFFIDRIEKPNRERTGDDLVQIPLRPIGRQFLGVFDFPKGLKQRMRLIADLPDEGRKRTGYQVIVRQFLLDPDQELGRVTWYLAAPDFFERREAQEKCLFDE